MSNYAFGIDLGTTNSCIAVKQGASPAKVITLADGARTLPSCVMYKNGKVVVGKEAYEHRFDTKHVVYSSKRDIGSDKKYIVYANGDDVPPIEVTPVDVASEILKKLKDDAELLFGKGFIKDVTITVPAYFTLERRVATINAAKQAGLNVISLINEPTSAALAYTEGKSASERVMVYDLGGGTFDVTLLEMIGADPSVASLFDEELLDSKMAKVISSAGDPWLGGDDLDSLVYEDAVATLQAKLIEQKVIPQNASIANLITTDSKERAILTIEQNKKLNPIMGLDIPVHIMLNSKDELKYIHINEAGYKRAALQIFKKSQKILKDCLEGRDISAVDKIILIGGSTKLEAIRELIRSIYKGTRIYLELNPDEAVALGAAVNSAIMQGNADMAVTDVLPQSIGIKIISIVGEQHLEGRYCKLVNRNTPLPVSVKSVVMTSEPGQKIARIPIFQGEDPIAENNTPVGSVCLELTPVDDIQDITVEMTINPSGILQVTVASESNVAKATIQNILNPVVNKKSKLEKLLTRYELTLEQYVDTEYYAEGKRLINEVKSGRGTLIDVQNFVNKLPVIEHPVEKSDGIPSELKSLYFRVENEDDEEDESSDD